MSQPSAHSDSNNSIHAQWRTLVARYHQPSRWRSGWQLINTLIPYAIGLVLMYWSLSISYWLTLALAVPTAGLLVRIFIISHDCGHGAFFKSRRANDIVGGITSFLCLTPYHYWKHEHAVHHASAGNLDERGRGDIWTMTVKEYTNSSMIKKILYRIYRNPLVLFGVGAFSVFMLEYRIPPRKGTARDIKSVWRTNFVLAAVLVLAYFTIGLKAVALIQFPVFLLAAGAGAWLFYVQHQFEDVYWARDKEWDYVAACMQGSSYYKLPRVLQWFTGNIGFHHIHHLSAKIPNYFLEKCHKENPLMQQVHQLSIWSSLACMQYRLWDEERKQLITFAQFRELQRAA